MKFFAKKEKNAETKKISRSEGNQLRRNLLWRNFLKKNDKKISQFLFFVIFFRLTADGGGGCFPEKKINSSEQKKVTLIFSPNSLND